MAVVLLTVNCSEQCLSAAGHKSFGCVGTSNPVENMTREIDIFKDLALASLVMY